MKYNSLMSAIEETGSTKAYYQQFSNVTPRLGGVYKVTGSGIITDYVEIIAEVDEVVGKRYQRRVKCGHFKHVLFKRG